LRFFPTISNVSKFFGMKTIILWREKSNLECYEMLKSCLFVDPFYFVLSRIRWNTQHFIGIHDWIVGFWCYWRWRIATSPKEVLKEDVSINKWKLSRWIFLFSWSLRKNPTYLFYCLRYITVTELACLYLCSEIFC